MMIDQLVDLLDHLVPEIPRLSTKCCLQIALLGTTLGFFHEKSLKGVAHKLVRSIGDITDMRIKDIERLLLAMTMFNFDPQTEPDFYATVLTELRREERWGEAQIFPKCLPCSLNYLAMRGVYDYELMSKVLDREYLMTNYGKKNVNSVLVTMSFGITFVQVLLVRRVFK